MLHWCKKFLGFFETIFSSYTLSLKDKYTVTFLKYKMIFFKVIATNILVFLSKYNIIKIYYRYSLIEF